MKIAFLCSSLEPGRDGVGDYTRLLAGACVDQGLDCRLLAFNDEHVAAPIEEFQTVGPHSLQCTRLPAGMAWDERITLAGEFVDEFRPETISWQIVPYGFHPKGIIPKDAFPLCTLGKGRFVHAMVHELWIGISRGEPLKNRAYGRLQRRALMNFLQELDPAVIDTSNVTYQAVLSDLGCVSMLLPLFGNIPIAPVSVPPPSEREWMGTIFGTVHPQFKPEAIFSTLIQGAQASGRTLRAVGIGRLGTYGEEMFSALRERFGNAIRVEVAGEKSPEEVSHLLQLSDFGIATHPWALIGKSGAVAAMLDHGLPVVVARDDWVLRKRPLAVPPIDPLVVKREDVPPELMAGWLARKRPAAARLPAVAATFLSRLGIGAASSTQSV